MISTGSDWDSKTVKRGGVTHIELRKNLHGGQVLIIVAVDGWNKDRYESRADYMTRKWGKRTEGFQVRISMNGPALMTMDQFNEIHERVHAAMKELLDASTD